MSEKEFEVLSQNAQKAMRKAVRNVIADRKMRGQPLIVLRDGKVVRIPADQL